MRDWLKEVAGFACGGEGTCMKVREQLFKDG
jgi:hypothetical protein